MNASASGPEAFGASGYTVEVLSRITGVPASSIRRYQEEGLIRRAEGGEAPFDDEALRALRRLERLREVFGVEAEGLKLLAGLLDEVERLRAELRARR